MSDRRFNAVVKTGSQGRLVAKDFIVIAAFTVVMFLFMMVLAIVMSFSTDTAFATHGIGGIVMGIPWVYLMMRVPKRGAALATGALMALVAYLMGMFWTGPVGMLAGGAVAEAILGLGKRSKAAVIASFAAFVLCWWVGHVSLLLLAGDSYVEEIVRMGMTREYGEGLVSWARSPLFFVTMAATPVLCALGGFIGTKVFAKHFSKISR